MNFNCLNYAKRNHVLTLFELQSVYSFLEQWTEVDGLEHRSVLFGPHYVARETGDFEQIVQATFCHGTTENFKHINAFMDGEAVGMEMESRGCVYSSCCCRASRASLIQAHQELPRNPLSVCYYNQNRRLPCHQVQRGVQQREEMKARKSNTRECQVCVINKRKYGAPNQKD